MAEDLGYDGLSVAEHHTVRYTCPSPHLLLAAAAMKTSRIRLSTAVTLLPFYGGPIRVAEEAGMLDLLSNGRFELGIGRGTPNEARIALGRGLSDVEFREAWQEHLDVVKLALTEEDFTYHGKHIRIEQPTTLGARPIQENFPVWLAATSLESSEAAGRMGWGLMRNFGSEEEHRTAFEAYAKTSVDSGFAVDKGNMMIERFIAIGETPAEVDRSLDAMSRAFGGFVALYARAGRTVPDNDGEFAIAKDAPAKQKGRPAIAIVGTPDEVIEQLATALDETGAGRLLVEAFEPQQSELFAREVMPALKEIYASRNA